jgi:Bacterial Ig-like domain/Immunoglobulin domain
VNAIGTEAQLNRANTLNKDVMKAYLEDVRLAMQKCGAFGKPAIFHWEPDLLGFMEYSEAFLPNDPNNITVKVGSTGVEEVASFPDTATGLCKAIIALRDLYAPKVLLGLHLSYWSSRPASEVANFAAKLGKWDILFSEISDRDKGFMIAHKYHYISGDPYLKEKDWNAFRENIGAMHTLTGLPVIMWQLPMGNTVMAACNDTEGHYMDQCVEYWLDGYPGNQHIAEWAESGIIGLIYGPGAKGCTQASDDLEDGVTNPAPVTGNQGRQSIYADDDGGYLRLCAADYFKTGALRFESASSMLPSAPSTALAVATAPDQITITWTDHADNESGIYVERKTGDDGAFTQIANLQADSVSFVDSGLTPLTTYVYRVSAFNAAGSSDCAEASATTPAGPVITVQPANCSVTIGHTATFSVVATGTSLTYQWKKGAISVGTGGAKLTIPNAQISDAGSYTVTVISGTSVVSNAAILAVTITPDTTPPGKPFVSKVIGGSASSPLFSGTAEPGATVTLFNDGTDVDHTTVAADGTWTLAPNLPVGKHIIHFTATDGAGNTSVASDPVTVTVLAPPEPSSNTVTNEAGDGGSSGGGCGLGKLSASVLLLSLFLILRTGKAVCPD